MSTYNISLQEGLSCLRSIEPKIVAEKLLQCSSSILNNLTYNNIGQCIAYVGRSLDPRNIERKLLSWSSAASSYIEQNPIIFSISIGDSLGGTETQAYVNLPFLGAVSLDTFLFCSSAILSSAHIFWRNRLQSQISKDNTFDNDNKPRFCSRPPSPPVKATIVTGYKDKSLYRTIKECEDVRRTLRKVEDPEVARKEKKRQLSLQNVRSEIKGKDSSDGYLGMSPGSLQDARKVLRQVQSNRIRTQRATE